MSKKLLTALPFLSVLILAGCVKTIDKSSSLEDVSSSLSSNQEESSSLISSESSVSSYSSISSSSSVVRDFYEVEFNYNNPSKKGSYLNVIVNKGRVLNEPKEPNIQGFVFDCWCLDAEGKEPYKRWGLEIDKDLILYAKWRNFADLTDEDKIDEFNTVLKSFSKNAKRVNKELKASCAYPALAEDIFYVADKYDYKRYKDITTIDHFYLEDDEKTYTYYGVEQFYYQNNQFWDVFHSVDPTVQSYTKTSVFSQSKVESFLSIDFTNMYGSLRSYMLQCLDKPEKYVVGENFECEFTGDYTALAEQPASYEWKEYYYIASYSDTIGDWSVDEYEFNYSINISNGQVTHVHIVDYYNNFLGQECYYMSSEDVFLDYYYGDGTYPDYTGERYVS